MRVVVVVEQRFDRTPDGVVWTPATLAYPDWLRYHGVFEEVRVVARVREVPSVPTTWLRASGPGVKFHPVPYYVGSLEYLARSRGVRRAVRSAVDHGDAVLLRLSSPLAGQLMPSLYASGRPYAVQVVGDPYDVFAPGAIDHPLRAVFRHWFSRQLKRQVRRAVAAMYVTEHALQRRYPASPGAFSINCSNVDLPAGAFVDAPRSGRSIGGRPVSILSVGTMEQLYKAFDVQILAVAGCVHAGMDVRLAIVGDGKHRPELEQLARKAGVAAQVEFVGQLPPGPAVRNRMDRADLFLLPSRTEGLPRAMIEGMARGLPCIGSNVGGIPELLPPEDLVPPGDVQALATKIQAVAADPVRMARMSSRNLAKAREYGSAVLSARRTALYRHLRDRTEAWLAAPGRLGQAPGADARGASDASRRVPLGGEHG